jgi:hypothetical protein
MSGNPPALLGENAPGGFGQWLCLTASDFRTDDAMDMRYSESHNTWAKAHPRKRARSTNRPPIPEGYTTIDRAAQSAGFSAGALWYYVAQEYIPSIKIDKHRFVKPEDVMRYKAQKDAKT